MDPMEGYQPSTYGDRFVDVYDDWYGAITDTTACVETVTELARQSRSSRRSDLDGTTPSPRVLELGVGTGRLAIPMTGNGLDVTGVDASAAMLSALAAKPGGERVRTVVADMVDPPVAAGFDLVLIAYNTLFNLTAPGDQARCLARVAGLLAPTGRLVVEAFVPDPATGQGDAVSTRQVSVDRVVLSVSRTDPAGQQVHGQYVDITEAGVKLRPWQIRWATPDQIDEQAAEAGLARVARWSDWERGTFTSDSSSHVSVYEPVRPRGDTPTEQAGT